MRWYRQAWMIPLVAALLLIASTTFNVIWLTHHPQVVIVKVEIPGFGGVSK